MVIHSNLFARLYLLLDTFLQRKKPINDRETDRALKQIEPNFGKWKKYIGFYFKKKDFIGNKKPEHGM